MHRKLVQGLAAASMALAMLITTGAPSAARHYLEVVVTEDGQSRSVLIEETDFQNLPQTTIVTDTRWTEGEARFTGVLLRDLLEHLELPIREVTARALNDYEAVIPASDIETIDVLVANRMNGQPMPVREKGPLWIIYPLSERPDLLGPETEEKMVWQLHNLILQ